MINTDQANVRKGDLVVLQPGEIVPADLKLVETRGLEIDEFDITGEITPVLKKANGRDAMIYMGSRVVRGAGKAIVIATGEQTEYGKVLQLGWEHPRPYGFRIFKKKYLGLVGLVLPAFILYLILMDHDVAVVVIFTLLAFFLLLLQNDDLFRRLLLSSELNILEHRQILIRDAKALEKMKEISLMCFDKTGVLTTRQMDVVRIYFTDKILDADSIFQNLDHRAAQLVKMACALCHDVFFYEKMSLANPIDQALIAFAMKNGVNVSELLRRYKRIYDLPFDSENRYMASGYEMDGKSLYFAKGDPGVILRMCSHYLTSTGVEKKVDFAFWLSQNSSIDAIGKDGDNAIALAFSTGNAENSPTEYTFLCLVQFVNPLQAGVRETVGELAKKEIRSVLLTGDRPEIAGRIGVESGMTKNAKAYLDGRTLERMEPSEVARQSAYCSVFARLTPSQKGVLIRLFQQQGHCVAMVGDGPNDGLALKAADIGISFTKDSSPIAMRLSKILIHELADLPRLVESARRIAGRAKRLKLFRFLTLGGIFVCIYGWILVVLSS